MQPSFLQFIALLAFHVFIREEVDVAILETHHEGEFDANDFIESPIVTAITSLGTDHVNQLGPTIGRTAWYKAGIFESGVPDFSAPQGVLATGTLNKRAAGEGVRLHSVDDDPSLPDHAPQLTPEVQRITSSVALAAVRSFLN